jgi:hypothetical protein
MDTAMAATVDYYMTPVSPFTYFGHERFRAICRDREILSPRDEIGLSELGRRTSGIRSRISSQSNAPPSCEIHWAGLEKHPAGDHQYDGCDKGDSAPETARCQERA